MIVDVEVAAVAATTPPRRHWDWKALWGAQGIGPFSASGLVLIERGSDPRINPRRGWCCPPQREALAAKRLDLAQLLAISAGHPPRKCCCKAARAPPGRPMSCAWGERSVRSWLAVCTAGAPGPGGRVNFLQPGRGAGSTAPGTPH